MDLSVRAAGERAAAHRRSVLHAIQLGTSERCATARTLTVWKDAAMSAVGEVSRGGSVVTHWADDERGASWTKAAQQLAAEEGPFY